jgi:HemY protein
MIRLVWTFLVIAGIAGLLTWFADRPGQLTIDWLDYRIELSVFSAFLLLAAGAVALWFLFWLTLYIVGSPWALGSYVNQRRNRRGMEALSNGLVAVGAGDVEAARREAKVATKVLGSGPLVKLLEAQAAQLSGNHAETRQTFEAMLADPSTELLGLRGLYADAKRNGDHAQAAKLAKQACEKHPGLTWASQALLTEAAIAADWTAAETLINRQRQNRVIDEKTASRWLAAVLTAEAIALEETDEARAAALSLRAHGLDPALAPAAIVAARRQAQQGNLRKARKIIERTWSLSPHPDLGTLYAFARPGDGPLDRLKHVRQLLRIAHGGEEGAVVLARAAIDAREWQEARNALDSYAAANPSPRICVLMAEVEEGQSGDKGKAREWLSRALRGGAQDPAWVDPNGYVSSEWLAASPVTGEIGGFAWRQPAATGGGSALLEQLAQRMEALPAPVAAVAVAAPALEEPAMEAEIIEPIETPARAEMSRPEAAPASPPIVIADVVDPGVPEAVPASEGSATNGFHQPDDPGIDQPQKAAQKSWLDRLLGG